MTKVSESAHQITLINWFDRNYPEYKGRLFAIPNGGLRTRKQGAKLKMEGVRRGVPDLFLPIPMGVYNGFFIELKIKGGRESKEQKDWVEFLSSNGYLAEFIYGWEEASEKIKRYIEHGRHFKNGY